MHLSEMELFNRELVRLMHDFERCPDDMIKKHIYQDIMLLKRAIQYNLKTNSPFTSDLKWRVYIF